MEQPESPPSTGLVAGKYELVTMIGRGGMGSVWEARHASLGTRFAIKFIEAEYSDSAEARTRFDREARAAATIQSKHAIQIYDHGVTGDGKPYIVMELLQGEPLDKRIERLGQLSLQDTARILQQVCRGLARAHERGIVHRDLKPENIFLVQSTDDDDEVAKVLDFGIAKVSNSPHNPGISSSTKTGAVLGTPFFMSPEQARGLRNVDHRTDVWSLGIIAFKCVTGKLPFDGESVGDLLVKICTSPIPVPSHVAPGLPPSFDAWFARALEREPDRRFATVTELADALGYAAGMAPRSAVSSNNPALAHLPTVGSGHGHGVSTPPVHGATPPFRGSQPSYGNYGTPPGPMPMQGAAMTNAPFTSSKPIAGLPSGRGKLVAGALVAVVVIAGAIGASVMVLKEKGEETRAEAARLTAPPPPPVSATVLPLPAAEPPPAPTPSATPEPPPEPPAVKAATNTKSAPAKTTSAPAKTPPAKTPPAPIRPTPTTTPSPATSPTAPAKKPPRNPDDPGY